MIHLLSRINSLLQKAPKMGQAKSRSQNVEQLAIQYVRLPKQDPIFLARAKLSDETDIKISTQTDGLLKSLFVWNDEFGSNPDDGWGRITTVFVDRSFEMKTKTEETIKIAVILSWDWPNISFKVKVIQGGNLFTNIKVMKFTYAHENRKGYFGTGSSPDESELLEEEFERTSSGEHPHFGRIFL